MIILINSLEEIIFVPVEFFKKIGFDVSEHQNNLGYFVTIKNATYEIIVEVDNYGEFGIFFTRNGHKLEPNDFINFNNSNYEPFYLNKKDNFNLSFEIKKLNTINFLMAMYNSIKKELSVSK